MSDKSVSNTSGAWSFEQLRKALEGDAPKDTTRGKSSLIAQQMAKLDAVAKGELPEAAGSLAEDLQKKIVALEGELLKRRAAAVEKVKGISLPQFMERLTGEDRQKLTHLADVQSVPHIAVPHIEFAEKTAEELVMSPPQSREEKENRCLVAYFVALGLAELHRNGLCHMDVKAEHVQMGAFGSSPVVYARLLDEGSVVFQGDALRKTTEQYLDMDCDPESVPDHKRADTAHDMHAFGLFLFELMHGRSENPLLLLKQPEQETWAVAMKEILAKLSRNDFVDACIATLLMSAQGRLTAQQIVDAFRSFIGEERYGQLVSPSELSHVLDKVLSTQTVSPWYRRPRLTPELRQTLCSMMRQIAVSLMRLHHRGLVYMNVRPSFVTISRDKRGGPLSAELMYSPLCVLIGQEVECPDIHHVDFGKYKGMKSRVASPLDDCWALGITMLEAFSGIENNPFQSLAYDKATDQVAEEEWKRALAEIRPQVDPQIDRIIDGLLQSPEQRWSAEQVVAALSEILAVETADVLLRHPPQTPEDVKERLTVACEVARDFAEKNPLFDVEISPRFMELIRNPQSGVIAGARIVGGIPKHDSMRYQQSDSERNARCFGLFLFSLLYGEEAIGSHVDYENLPSRTSPEWQGVIETITSKLEPKQSKKTIDPEMEAQILTKRRIDVTIKLLLTDEHFGVDYSIGVLQDVLDRKQ